MSLPGQVSNAGYTRLTDDSGNTLGTSGSPLTNTIEGSPDSGVTFKYLKTTSDGTQVANSTLQAGVALAGGFMTYREMVARSLVGNVKYLTGSVALGASQSAAISFKDQGNNSYSTVTNGKTLYVAQIDATCDIGASSAAQTSLMTLTDGTNLKYEALVSQNSPSRSLEVPLTLASGTTLTVKAGASNLATPAGSLYVSILCWEE